MGDQDDEKLPPIRVPLSLRQQEIWDWLAQWPKAAGFYNDTIRVTLAGRPSVDLVRQVLDFVVERHEPLRTTFHEDGEGTYQSIGPTVEFDVPFVDLTSLPPAERDVELQRLLVAQNAEPLDLRTGPPFRVALYKTGDNACELAITLQHIISDQTTDSILYGELLEAHAAFARGEKPDLPTLPIQFADFAIWERQWLTEDRLREGCDYWRAQLRGMPLDVDLPCDRPRRHDGDKRTSGIDFFVPPDVHAGLDRLTRDTSSTLFIVFVAAAQCLLARCTGETDAVVLTTFHGRDRRELEGMMGIFAGAALLRSDLSGDPTFRQVVDRARGAVLGMLEHQFVPFDTVVDAVVADLRAQGVDAFPQVPLSIEFFHAPRGRLLSGMSLIERRPDVEGHVSAESADIDDIINPLAFRIFGGDQLWGRLSYHDAVFDQATVEHTVADFKALLSVVSVDPGVRLSALPVGAVREAV
ncbi:MAG TPA: condensation domain-containing protein [Acidimicrobiales bacterium]|nr:condensation domain-containing protein [Acidimicrobiales bacterium]